METKLFMDNIENQMTDYSTAYDHSADDFNFLRRVNRMKSVLHKNEIVIALELAIAIMLGGLAYLLIIT